MASGAGYLKRAHYVVVQGEVLFAAVAVDSSFIDSAAAIAR